MTRKTTRITKTINRALRALAMRPNRPKWDEETKHWHVEGMRYQHVYVETLEKDRLPIKWVFREIFGQFGIESKDLHAYEIRKLFEMLGFKTGVCGQEDMNIHNRF